MPEEKKETRAEEIARVRGYLASQAMKRTPAQLVDTLREAHQQFLAATAAVPDALFRVAPEDGEWSADDVEKLIPPRKPGLAFTLGAMGSREHNFYNETYRRMGYADVALEVQNLWLNKQREAAAARVPDELVLKTNLLGTEDMVRERLRVYQAAGVTTLRVEPDGNTLDERVTTLARLLELVKKVE